MIWFCDTHSYDAIKSVYTFPTYKQLKTFYKTRIAPEFSDGYYASLVDKAHEMSQEQMKIRNSTLIFRSSSKAGSLEGIDADMFAMDEYDHIDSTAEQSALEAMSSSKYGFMRRWSTPKLCGGLF